ncbi:MAG: DUF2461 domain-containing protein, partial [Bacteroidota bacterium]
LKELKLNNHKAWFDENRKRYEYAKEDYLNLVKEIIEGVGENDPSIALLQPKECVFRINRDVRFSKDKSPYKTNMGAGFSKGGKKSLLSGYYFHCEPGTSFIGGGIWMPPAPELKKVRQEIDYNYFAFQEIINNPIFKNQYGDLERSAETLLSRPPKGYDEENPAIDYLKLKSFIASTSIKDEELTNKELVSKIVTAFAALQPLIYFINQALEL